MKHLLILILASLLVGCVSNAPPKIKGLENTREINVNSPETIKNFVESIPNEQEKQTENK